MNRLAGLLLATAVSGSLWACGDTTTTIPLARLEGVVIDVDSAELNAVNGFTIRTESEQITFVLGSLQNPLDFPPSHLVEHLASGEPIRVWYRMEDGALVAYRIEDAGG